MKKTTKNRLKYGSIFVASLLLLYFFVFPLMARNYVRVYAENERGQDVNIYCYLRDWQGENPDEDRGYGRCELDFPQVGSNYDVIVRCDESGYSNIRKDFSVSGSYGRITRYATLRGCPSSGGVTTTLPHECRQGQTKCDNNRRYVCNRLGQWQRSGTCDGTVTSTTIFMPRPCSEKYEYCDYGVNCCAGLMCEGGYCMILSTTIPHVTTTSLKVCIDQCVNPNQCIEKTTAQGVERTGYRCVYNQQGCLIKQYDEDCVGEEEPDDDYLPIVAVFAVLVVLMGLIIKKTK